MIQNPRRHAPGVLFKYLSAINDEPDDDAPVYDAPDGDGALVDDERDDGPAPS
jgi:hypothetical protein